MHIVDLWQHGYENDDMVERQGDEAALDVELPPARNRRANDHYPCPDNDKHHQRNNVHDEFNPRHHKSPRHDTAAARYHDPAASRHDGASRHHDPAASRHDGASRHHATNNRGLKLLLPQLAGGDGPRGRRQRRILKAVTSLSFV